MLLDNVADVNRTAAVRWHNGTLEPITQVEGSEPYLQLMKQLSSAIPRPRVTDDIPTTTGKIRYILNHFGRFINKLLHRPANRQTRILAEMLVELKESVESAIIPFRSITHAVVTSPDGIYLAEWELNDVLDYLHIKNLMETPDDLYSVSAAFAGTGNGLCKRYTDIYTCEAEEEFDFPAQFVLNVDFSDQALRMTIKTMKTYKVGGGPTVIDTKLAYIEGLSDDAKETLFQKIREKMKEFVQNEGRKITIILLTGTRVSDRRFKETLRDALGGLVTTEALTGIDESLVQDNSNDMYEIFATAKGAAEVAKRRLEAPVRCRWRKDCAALKERKDKEGTAENIEL